MQLEIYHTYIDVTDTAATERLWKQLPPARRAMLVDRAPAARAEGTALAALLAYAVSAWGGDAAFQTVSSDVLTVPFAHWETATDGKPFPRGISTPHGVVFASFSHSLGHLLVALCDRPLGADIQVWDSPALTPDRCSRLAARITHPAETPPETPRETARLFAAKEAVLKLNGDGLRHAMSSVNTADFAVAFYEELSDCIVAVATAR